MFGFDPVPVKKSVLWTSPRMMVMGKREASEEQIYRNVPTDTLMCMVVTPWVSGSSAVLTASTKGALQVPGMPFLSSSLLALWMRRILLLVPQAVAASPPESFRDCKSGSLQSLCCWILFLPTVVRTVQPEGSCTSCLPTATIQCSHPTSCPQTSTQLCSPKLQKLPV